MFCIDLPIIVSGERYVVMDPLEIIKPRKNAHSQKLSDLSRDPTALSGFSGICSDCHNFANKTLFRFPLRKQRSKLSDVNYTPEKLWNTLDALRKEAKYLLLFLRSVQTIGVYKITYSGKEMVFSVSIAKKDWQRRHENLRKFEDEIKYHFLGKQLRHEVRELVSQFRVVVAEQDMTEREYEWLVVQQVGSASEEVLDMVRLFNDRGESVLPWVGTAIELAECQQLESGRIFCFLPMPFEKLSPLPVHVNGTFAVSKDRRSLKWPTIDRQADPGAQWNELLTKFCLSSCYKQLIVSLTERKPVLLSTTYKAWPDPSVVCRSEWNGLLGPLFSTLFQERMLYSKARGGQWVTLDEALLTPESIQISEIVSNCLLKSDLKLVNATSLILEVINFCTDVLKLSLPYKCISPDIVTETLKCNPACYKSLSYHQKLDLLSYCINVSEYSALEGIELLPLANGNFVRFQEGSFADKVYLSTCSTKFPSFLLPSFGSCLVKVDDKLQSCFEKLAASDCTQVCEMTLDTVATLLPQSIKKGWSVDQYRSFWNWVQHHDLSYFTECPIIPIADGSHIVPVNLSADEVVLITEFNKHMLMPSLLDAFKKIGIKIARQDQYCFLKHDNILNYVSHFTPEGILSIASFSGQTTFTFTEGKALQAFLATSDITTSRSIESLCKMRIFYILQQENRLFSINEVANRRFYGALAEDSNCPFKIRQKFLPLQPLVLAQRNNNTTLWNNVCLITMYDYICEHAFPLIREKSFSGDRRKGFMVEVLQLLLSLSESDDNRKKVVEEMSTVPFLLDHKNTLKCPTELFDSNCDRVMSLYKGEPVFPMHPFNLKKYSRLLRQAGLKHQEDVTANDILEIVNQIKCNGNSPQTVGRNRYDRACAVMKHLSEKPLLLDKTTTASIFDFTLLDDLTCLDQTSWLPVCSTPPTDYPRCLSWKGSSYPSCLASQAVGIVPLTHELSLITGSQLFFLQDAELTLKLRPSQDVLLQAVAKHFIEVVNCKNINRYSRDKIVDLTYTYLRDNDGHDIVEYLPNKRWIWLENRQALVESSNVAIHSNNNFSSNLEPFITVLSDKYERQFHVFFETLGVPPKITIQQILSVLKMIKERTVAKVSYTQAWQMVTDILHWVADSSDKIDFKEVLVPVQSTNYYPVLMPINQVVYIDSDLLMAFQQQPCSIIHEKISSGLYKKLRVRPLSEYLGISAELPQDVGQQEPLLQRLKNILKDYKDGLTIIKELLQNADDAGATELNIIYDSRNHKSNELLFPGMAKAHGPALIVHNDQTFTKKDFENITKLAGATKRDEPLKIGKFGVGFCSVYHITDVPSFVSGEWLYIFDPTLHHLPIKNLAQPGKMIHCTFPLLKRSRQLDPYESIHSYTPGHPYSGTIFRLPFRTCSSELSTKCYMESDIVSLKKQLEKEGTKLLLFLQHVKKITLSEWKQHYRAPQQLFQIHQTCSRISERVQQVKLQVNTAFIPESWLVSSYLNEHGSSYQSAAVASRLMPIDQGYKSSQVCGECFCSLPLGSQTGLPVHVSANFAVNTSRRDLDDSEKGVKWNRDLMQSAITRAYLQLLIALRDLALNEHDTKCISLHEYSFHSLWPIKEHLEHVNPWNILINELYKEISTHDLFYSHPKLKWQRLSDCKFICTKILDKLSFEPIKCVAQGLEILCEPTVDLPEKFHHCFPNMTFIYENEFIDTFLNNISSFSSYTDTCTRDKIIVLILELYSRQTDKKKSDFDSDLNLDFNLASTAFIPCTPNGNLKLCKDLADPTSSIAELFKPKDGYFPIEMLCDSQPAMRAMRILGLQMETVSYEALADCARRIPSLYHKNKEKAIKNLILIMKCVEKQFELDFSASSTKCKILNDIPFLPVMQKPENYVLPWYGEIMLFQSPCNLVHGPKLPDLVGSQVAIVDAEVERKSPSHILSHIGVKTEPELSIVITQLRCLLEIDPTTVDKDAIGHTYTTICDFLQKKEEEALFDDEKLDLSDLKTLPCVWTGQLFVKPDCVAKNWKCDGPILYPIPEALRSKTSLQKSLGCKDSFSIVDLLNALSLLYQADCSEPLNKQSQELVRDIVAELDKFKEELFENCNENDTLALPDTSFVMCKVSDLVFNDVEWDSDNNRIVHGCVTISLAKKLGVVFIRNKVLESSELRKFPGVPFGQKETLQRRITDILQQYPFDETFIKEILQNADDAKATKLCVILDKRQLVSKKNKMISDNWNELQGPALLLWNNSTFTDKDLQGIQDLGTGGKRGDSDTIGQFGIGFSVVYHVTDCPSIVTSVDGVSSLCVFDPLCKYVPGADVSNPGRRYEIKESFWKNFPAIKQGYNIDKLDGCPDNMKEDLWKGSLFRLPLRKNDSENPESYYCSIQTEFKPDITTAYLFHRIKQWIEDVKLSLLFLNHVTDIEFYMIDEGQKMTLLASHSTELTEDAKKCRNDLEGALASFDNDNMSLFSEPKVFLYQIKIASIVWSFRDESQKAKPPKVKKESWLVQEGVGDIFLSDRKWPAHNFKPRHGLAAALQPGQFKRGQVFCFLPLPSSSSFKLPVHINGQFMLENTRRNLWTPSNPNISDNRSCWNTYLLEAISSSYAQFLQDAIPFFVSESYESYEVANNNLTEYYNIFPTYSKAQIKDKVLTTLSQQNARILCSVKEQSKTSSRHQYVTEWAPIKDENPLYQSYMFPAFQQPEYIFEEYVSEEDQQKRKEEQEEEVKMLKESHDRLRFLIARIGMNINSVPNCICRALNIPEANGREVLSFCKSFPEKIGALPCSIKETSINSVENFAALLEYACSDYAGPHLKFIDGDHVGAPFLLTADRHLQLFTEDHRVIYCEQLDVFVHSSVIKHFAHPKMIEMNIEPAYFYQANEKRFYFVSQILLNTFPRALLRNNFEGPCTNSCVLPKETLKRIWKCLTKTQVFRYHLTTILKQWALIPSEQNDLFLYSDQDVLPVDMCTTSLTNNILKLTKRSQSPDLMTEDDDVCIDDDMEKIQLQLHVGEILEQLGMPVLDITVVSSECLCDIHVPSILEPVSVLKNLKHWNKLHQMQLKDDETRCAIFQYFSVLNFGNKYRKNLNREYIQSLQLFKNVDERLTYLSGKKVFVWPCNIELAGLSEWLPDDCVFLEEDGKWKYLGIDQEAIVERKIDYLAVYTDYILPNFDTLDEADRYKHLEHIKDRLLPLFRSDNRAIKQLFAHSACIENELGELKFVSELCDSSVNLFCMFHNHFSFPHYKYQNEEWLPFLREMGLQQEVTMEKYEELCKLVQSGQHENLQQSSEVLLEYLLLNLRNFDERFKVNSSAEDWSCAQNRDFLERIFEISFVIAEHLPHLNWIVKPCAESNCIQCGDTTYHLTKLNGAAISDVADTVWTVKPVVKLPEKYHSDKADLLSDMGLIIKPSLSIVLENVHNIVSCSKFGSISSFDKFGVDFELSEQHNLLRVMLKNFERLKTDETEELEQIHESLASLECVPIFAGNSTQPHWFILVEPLCVIANSSAKDYQPFLNPLPEDLMNFMPNVLSHIGVKHELDFDHCCYALKKIYQCSSENEVDVNTRTTLEKLLEQMYSIMLDQKGIDNCNDIPLYLPSIHFKLMPSNCLVYCDEMRYRTFEYNVSEDSCVSVLLLPNFDGARVTQFCELLPEKIRPKRFSYCKHVLFSQNETETNDVTENLERALQIHRSIHVLESILINHQVPQDQCKLLLQYFQDVLYCAKVVSIANLKVKLFAQNPDQPEADDQELATCKVDYFIQEERDTKKSIIYIDASVSNKSVTVKVYFPIAKHMMNIASIGHLQHLPHVIFLLLQLQSEEEIDNLFEDSSIPLSSATVAITPKLGALVPICLHHKLDQDVKNIFRPGEWVGFATSKDEFIFAQIYCPNSDIKSDNIYDNEYYIVVSDDDNDEQLCVSIIKLYKFMRSSQVQQSQIDDTTNEQRASSSIQHNCDEIIEALDSVDEEHQQLNVRRLLLKWNPKSNQKQTALVVYTFLIEELKRRGLYVTEIEECDSIASTHQIHAEQNPGPVYEHFEVSYPPDIPRAQCWLEQAMVDKKVLDVVLIAANEANEMCGHVCFLAHEVAEKALKAGMYAIHGKHTDAYLGGHQIKPLYENITHKLLEDSSRKMRDYIHTLMQGKYYLKTRFPNQWYNGSLPADQFTLEQAQEAQEIADYIIQTVTALIP